MNPDTEWKPSIHPPHPLRKSERKTTPYAPRTINRSSDARIQHDNGTSDPRDECCFGGTIFFDALKAMLSRMLLLLHAVLTLWRVCIALGDIYWCLGLTLVAMMAESGFVLLYRKAKDWKWFSPCIALYLASVLPGLWILELNPLFEMTKEEAAVNDAQVTLVPVGARVNSISMDQWKMLLQQSMLLLIILCRWLMPKGDLTRDQLSGLLLGYVGTASDCVDFFAILVEDKRLARSVLFKSIVLGFYSWSLFQFIFVKTTVNEEDGEEEEDTDGEDCTRDANRCMKKKAPKSGIRSLWKKFVLRVLQTELWAIFVTLVMQDAPFLAIRVTVIFMFSVSSQTHFFFTAKNALMIILQIYRAVAVYQQYKSEERQKKEKRSTAWKQIYKKITYMLAFREGNQVMDATQNDVKISILSL